jgi:tRNA-splicing ligase RtcB (3'-phosphate/5'-hydroxy nucleic acid ligase)
VEEKGRYPEAHKDRTCFMNARQLAKLGVPQDCVPQALQVVQAVAKRNRSVPRDQRIDVEQVIRDCVEQPEQYRERGHSGEFSEHSEAPAAHEEALRHLADALVADREFVRKEPIPYRTWGEEIDGATHHQMKLACSLPMAVAAALMPDAHVGYGLPIGGVLALDNAVVPYAVGVDIACRMRLSIYDIRPELLADRKHRFVNALERGTVFGVGQGHEKPQDHPVLDRDWSVTQVTRTHKDLAREQLGSSGSGNHFAEFGVLLLEEDDAQLGLKAGQYVALLTHSGSRGTGSAVCQVYSGIAQSRLPVKYKDLGRLAWLEMDSAAGQEYWAAMSLMGEYAAANHEVIHRNVSKLVGERPFAFVENHHNFAWKETHEGRTVIVHRKGATPAAEGVMGVIPGSMADPAFVVRGRGVAGSLHSASHGAGRKLSRKQAKDRFSWHATKTNLEQRGITVLSAAADEVPGVYKDIEEVMASQADLVDKVARFEPRIVRMAGEHDGAAED